MPVSVQGQPILSPVESTLRILASPSPLSIERGRIDALRPVGGTVGDLLRSIGWVPPGLSARVFIDGELVREAEWETAVPQAGQVVTVRAIPQGGEGKTALRIVAMLAIVVAAVYTGGAAASALGPGGSGLFGFGGFTAAQAGAIGTFISAGLTIAGSLAVSLIPPPKPKLEALSGGGLGASLSPTLSLTGSSNKMAPYAPIPRVYGRHLVYPPLAARPYTEIEGDNQFLRLLFCVGYGPLALSDFKIGATPLSAYTAVQTEIRYGYPDDPVLTLFTDDVFEDAQSILLTQAAGGQTRNTQPNADEISLDLTFPNGLATFDTQGVAGSRSVQMNVEYRVAGSGGSWTSLSSLSAAAASAVIASAGADNDLTFTARTAGFGGNNIEYRFVTDTGNTIRVLGSIIEINMIGSTANAIKTAIEGTAAADALITVAVEGTGLGTVNPVSPTGLLTGGRDAVASLTITDNRQTLLRTSWRWRVPRAQYEVRVTRVTADTTDPLIRDTVYWTTLRTIRSAPAVTKTGVAYIAMRIKATDQLNGQVDQFNLIAHSILRDWTGSAWIARTTSNPASIVRDILQGSANRNALADSRVDLTTLQGWHGRCAAKGFAFNHVVDYRTTVFELMKDVAAVGRASYGQRDGKHSVIEDIPQSTPVHVLTPRNSWGFRGTKTFVDLPHALNVRFVNPDKEWQQDERPVLADGYGLTGADGIRRDAFGNPTALPEATKFETLDTLGVTSADHAWKLGRYHLAVATLRPETYEFSVDFEHLIMTRGDLIRVVHDVPLFGLGAARITSVTLNSSGHLTAFGIDDTLTMETGKTYGVRIRKADGTQAVENLTTVVGDQTALALAAPLTVTRPAADDHSGNLAHGTYLGDTILGVAGALGIDANPAVQLTGTNGGYLTCGNPTPLQFASNTLTIDGWIKPASVALEGGANVCVASKFQDASNSWTVQLIPSGSGAELSFTARRSGVTLEGRSTALIQAGQWTHIACVLTYPALVIYVNGIDVTQATATPQPLPAGTDFLLGRLNAGSTSGRFVGVLDEIAYYDTALSAARIAAHYAARDADYRAAVIADDPEGYWRFGEAMSPTVGDLVAYGLAGQESVELIVKDMRAGEDLTARVICVDAAPGVHTADSGTIPAHDSHITHPPLLQAPVPTPIITQVVSDESVLLRQIDGSLESRIVISMTFSSGIGVPASHIQVQYRRTGSIGPWSQINAPITGVGMELAITAVQDSLAYDIMIRSVNSQTGQTSDWATILDHTVVGKTTPPASPTDVTRIADRLLWSYPTPPPDLAGFMVRVHTGTLTAWETAIKLHDGLISGTEFLLPPISGTVTYLVKAVDVADLESAAAASLTFNEGAVVTANVVDSVDHDGLGWTGTQVNGTVVSGDLVADSLTLFWSPDGALFWGATGSNPFWPTDTFAEMSYTASYTPSSTNLRATMKIALTVIASSWYVEYRKAAGPWMAWPGELTPIENVAYDIKVTTAAGIVRGTLSGLLILLDAPDIEEPIAAAAISNTGSRLTITKSYLAIKTVAVSIQGDNVAAYKLEVVDKNATSGPLIKARDAAGTLVAATVDATIKGY